MEQPHRGRDSRLVKSTMVMELYENMTRRDIRIVTGEGRGMIRARRAGVEE